MTLRVATYNVNSVRARLPLLIPWLEHVRPHIVCLQETKVEDPLFPLEAFREAGYDAVYRGDKAYNGVAILTTSKPTDVVFGFNDEGPPDQARLAVATIRGVKVVNTYVPQGRSIDNSMFRYKLDWLARLRRYFDRSAAPTDPVLWMGDFNVAPEAIDVHDPKRLLGHVCYHPEVSRALAEVRAWGFEDVFRKHVPETNQYSFFDYRVRHAVSRGVGWRVDHIWASEPLARRSASAWIDLEPRKSEGSSDHAPVLAEFDL